MKRKITVIKPKKELVINRKKVCAYARVSTGKDTMLHSLSAQISYYSSYIQKHGEWCFSGVYAEEAVTGTKDKRPEFQRMIADCKAGKIDMIITKSISRFARNTVTLLETVRMLKELNVDVYFEEQNIHTMSGDGELMLTILASFAQAESLSVSENCKWRIRNDFKQGIPNTFSLYGYQWKDRKLQIYEPEADVVKKIYDLYLSGVGSVKISHILNADNIPSPNGGKWSCQTVIGILKNEKYVGDMLLQKYYKKDHLSKHLIKNKGELPQYYVEDYHDGIIPKETKEEVNEIFSLKKQTITPNKMYSFKGIVFCSKCGCRYVRKKNYKKYVWKCNTFCNEGKAKCDSKQVPDSVLMDIANSADKEIVKIIVLENNRLNFIFEDNTEKEVIWQMPSRKWTDEMKAENYEALRKKRK